MELTSEMLKSLGLSDEQSARVLKAHTDNVDLWQAKYNALTESFNQLKATDSRREKEYAYHGLLREIGIADKYADAVLRVTDLDKLQLADGKLADADRLKSDAKSQWADFIAVSGVSGATVPTPPAPAGLPDYDAMSDSEYYKAVAQN